MLLRNILNKLDFDNKMRDFILLSGPCVIESYDICAFIAEKLKNIALKYNIPYVFKASFEKANRSSINSYTGPGLEEGLKVLAKIKKEFELKIVSDIHETAQIKPAVEVIDIIQIPAFLSRQTKLLVESAKTGAVVNVKKAQFMSYTDMKNVVAKISSTGNNNLFLTERGTSFGYNNLVVDFRGFMEMKSYDYPVIYDVSHSLQRPSAIGSVSGGEPALIKPMSMAAIATKAVDGLFIETHPNPEKALSDGKSMLKLDNMEDLINSVLKIKECVENL